MYVDGIWEGPRGPGGGGRQVGDYSPKTVDAALGFLLKRTRVRATFPAGTGGFELVRGGTARKFVRVLVDVSQDLDDYQRRFFEWLSGLAARGEMPAKFSDRTLYAFKSHGKRTELTGVRCEYDHVFDPVTCPPLTHCTDPCLPAMSLGELAIWVDPRRARLMAKPSQGLYPPPGPGFLMPYQPPFWVEYAGSLTGGRPERRGPFATWQKAAAFADRYGAARATGYFSIVDATGTEVDIKEGPGI